MFGDLFKKAPPLIETPQSTMDNCVNILWNDLLGGHQRREITRIAGELVEPQNVNAMISYVISGILKRIADITIPKEVEDENTRIRQTLFDMQGFNSKEIGLMITDTIRNDLGGKNPSNRSR